MSVRALAEIVKRTFYNKTDIDYYSARKGDFQGEYPDTGQSEKELGWEAEVGLEEGLRRYIQWYKENQDKITR